MDWAWWLPRINAAIERDSLTVDEAMVDLLNRGLKAPAWRLETGECTNRNHATETSDHSLMYQTDGIAINFEPEVFLSQQAPGAVSFAGGPVFTFKGRTYSYGMSLDLIGVTRFAKQKKDWIVGRTENVCSIQLQKR